jgi:hypothetical protein
MDSANVETQPQQIYYNYAIPLPPTTTVTNIDGTAATVVVSINGASGPSITISAGSTGYEFNTSGSTITLTVDNAATVRSSISAAKSSVNTDITELNGASQVDVSGGYKVNSVQVVTSQQPAIPDASGGATVDTEARTAINALLAALRIHGLIDT